MSRPTRPAGGFGYAINYDKEIARDRKELAHLEQARDLGIASIEPMWLPELVITSEAVAAKLGYTIEDRQALADACDWTEADYVRAGLPMGPVTGTPGERYRRGDAIAKRLLALWDGGVYSPDYLKKSIAQVRARLARHIRNRGPGQAVRS